jgi:hypothetical protein
VTVTLEFNPAVLKVRSCRKAASCVKRRDGGVHPPGRSGRWAAWTSRWCVRRRRWRHGSGLIAAVFVRAVGAGSTTITAAGAARAPAGRR